MCILICLRAVNNEISSVGHSEFQRNWRKLHNAAAFDGSNLFARGDSPERDPFSAFNRQKRIIERETGKATNVLGSVTTESLARDKIPNLDKRCLPVPSASQSNQWTGSARDSSMRWGVISLHGTERYGGLISLRFNF